MTTEFRAGDVVRPRPEEDHIRYFNDYLTGDHEYVVTRYDGTFLHYEGTYETSFAYRVYKVSEGFEPKPYADVIRKIKQIEAKRKALGYKW